MTEERKKKYLTKFDEIEIITSEILEEDDTESTEQKKERIKNSVLELLIDCYVFGVDMANEELELDEELDTDEMYEAIYTEIDGKTWEDRIADYVVAGTIFEIARVIDTESHRVLNEGKYDIAKGFGVKKTWITMMDNRVRDEHAYLEGTKIPITDKFYTYTGDSAYYPGGFETAENNCNCRCVIELGW